MKKLLLVLTASALMIFNMTASAFACTPSCPDQSTMCLEKVYKILNEGTTSPKDSFTFVIKPVSVKNSTSMTPPAFRKQEYTIEFDQKNVDKKITYNIPLPEFTRPGEYVYEITEKKGNTAGVKYSDAVVRLTVYVSRCSKNSCALDRSYTMTVVGNGSKTGGFENLYSAGSLEVTKTVTGVTGDINKEFKVDVTFTKQAGTTVKGDITYSDNGQNHTVSAADLNAGSHTVTVDVKDGETVKFNNIPYGVTYEVVEKDYSAEGYETSYDFSDPNKKVDSKNDTVTVVNSRNGDVPTGIMYSITLYVLAFAAVAGLTAVVIRRRKTDC